MMGFASALPILRAEAIRISRIEVDPSRTAPWSRGALAFVIQLNYISIHAEEKHMAANALVQTRIDAEVRDRASAVLEEMGLTLSDAVRILLTRTANEGALPLELLTNSKAHDAWFRAKVLEALNDTRPDISDEQAEAHFTKRRAAARRRTNELEP
jgi:DNA-damage-inducible protein J